MAADARASSIADEDEQFDTSTALRLGIWGVTAVIAVTTVILASRTDIGSLRVQAAVASIAAPPNDPPAVVIEQVLARTADVERETRRLAETVRTMTTDRERLTARLGSVEREVGDITGSIRRTPQRPPEAPPATSAAAPVQKSPPVAAAPPAPPSATVPSKPAPVVAPPQVVLVPPIPDPRSVRTVVAPPLAGLNEPLAAGAADPSPPPSPATTASVPEATPVPSPRPSEATVQASLATANSPVAGHVETAPLAPPAPPAATASAAAKPEAAEAQPKAEIGLDLGPGLTMARLRARWNAFKSAYATMAEGMRPIVSIREVGNNKPVEMRLVVGPVPDVHVATFMCASLVGTQFMCHPAVFDGQRLALK